MQTKIPGIVDIGARKNGKQLAISAASGLIMSAFFPEDRVTAAVTTAKNSSLVCFTGRKGFTPTPVVGTESEGRMVYEVEVEMKSNEHGVYNTSFYNGNALRYLAIDRFGSVRITEVAIVAEEYRLYVTKQEIYSARLYRDGQKIVCNAPLSEWTEMVAFAAKTFIEQNGPMAVSLLEPVETMEPQSQLGEISGNTGVVKFYSVARGVGAVQTARGLAKIHFSQVKATSPDQPKRTVELRPGQHITFKGLRTPKGETEFAHEIVEASLAT